MTSIATHAVTRHGATVYVVRIVHDVGTHKQRTRLVLGSDGRPRIWFDQGAAAQHAADLVDARTPGPAPLFD